jgi:tetratricopeptide (TPR) repeat protein
LVGAEQADSLQALYNNLGVIEALNGNTLVALEYFDSARAFQDHRPAVMNNLANGYLCLGQADRAISLFDSTYGLAEADKRILFNWSLALYVAGRVDESVEKMQEFLTSHPFGEEEVTFVSTALQDLPVSKADAAKLSKEEIRQLLHQAKFRLDKAIKKKHVADSTRTVKKPKSASDSAVSKKPTIQKQTTPAGEKAAEIEELAPMLHWIII